jgi:phosphoribosylamine--glycine ligase
LYLSPGKPMNILVVGSGAREHAIAWQLAKSKQHNIFAIPGNPGIAKIATCIPTPALTPETILDAARIIDANLTVVGPEAPLIAGTVDHFHANGRLIIGPTAESARLEGSKIYAKQFFRQHNIPTATFQTFRSSEDATRALQSFTYPLVIKTDGLAAGKGVIIAQDRAAATDAIQTLGPNLVLEEFLTGPEVSFMVLSDGTNTIPLLPSRDHKRIYDNDQGPNTGGMGAFCHPNLLTPKQTDEILDKIIQPTVAATKFTGFLYAGLIMTANGPKILEYNVRLGDPETQPIMCQLDSDLPEVLLAAATGNLSTHTPKWKPGASVGIVLASEGYPQAPVTGDSITGIEEAEVLGTQVFHAGTARTQSGLVTSGGRVLTVTATAPTLNAAIERAYAGVQRIHFRGMQFRKDIGRTAPNQL